MTTGHGGCVTTRDAKLAKEVELLRFHGMDREASDRFGKNGSQHYAIVKPGFKYNMMDIQAALGLHQIEALDGFIDRRTQLANRYYEKLGKLAAWTLPGKPDFEYRHAWHLFAPCINADIAGMDRDEFMAAMKAENIGTGLHYESVHLYPYYRETLGFKPGDFPNSENISSRIVSLPLFPDMTDAQQDRVINAILKLTK
jgi:dTDP-4-amino-4,6-dideoxygalactose transaminase